MLGMREKVLVKTSVNLCCALLWAVASRLECAPHGSETRLWRGGPGPWRAKS